MNAKQTLTTVCSAVALSLLTSTGAQAASTNKVFVSGPMILLFLGFCALVVVVQCIPAIITLYGMITGAAGSKENSAATARQ